MDAITINAFNSMNGDTSGCIYTRDANGADPEVCYTYLVHEGSMVVVIWNGNEPAIKHHAC